MPTKPVRNPSMMPPRPPSAPKPVKEPLLPYHLRVVTDPQRLKQMEKMRAKLEKRAALTAPKVKHKNKKVQGEMTSHGPGTNLGQKVYAGGPDFNERTGEYRKTRKPKKKGY